MNNKYNKIAKKVGVMGNYGGSTSIVNVGLRKSYIKSCIRLPKIGGLRKVITIALIFAMVGSILPFNINTAEAAK